MPTIIETERLILRQFTASDYKAVYEFGSNVIVQKYTGNKVLTSHQEAKDLIQNVFEADYKKHGYGRWAVVYKPENKIIGFSGLKYLPEFDLTDIGYRFLPEYWGKGIATESTKPIIDYGFKHFGLNQIVGICYQDNTASSKVLEKIGLTFYKVDDYDGDGVDYNWYRMYNPNAKG